MVSCSSDRWGASSARPTLSVYNAAKAFQVTFTEGLWAELHEQGVDVLSAVIGSTTTPGRAKTLGVGIDDSLDMSSEDVAHEIVENIANGPSQIIAKLTSGLGPLAEPWKEFRATALATMIEATKGFTQRTTSEGVH